MENLWAPWRIRYILGEREEGCIFCFKPQEEEDERNYIVHRGRLCYIILNTFPYNCGHLMIVPYRHLGGLEGLTNEESLELMRLTQLSIQVLREAIQPHGFNIGMNLGRVAGAGIDDHIHIHVVPRWNGDTNCMPVLCNTKVISEGLVQTFERLRPVFHKNEKGD